MQIIVVTIQPEAGNLLAHITQAMQLTNLEQNMRCGLLKIKQTNKLRSKVLAFGALIEKL